MNKCPKCGNKLSNIDVLCPKCGAFVEIVQPGNNNITAAEIAVSKDQSNVRENELTHDPRPELILYDEEFPKDIDTIADIDIAMFESQIKAIDDMPNIDVLDDNKPTQNDDTTVQEDDTTVSNDDTTVQKDDSNLRTVDDDLKPLQKPPIDESVYSESYLNTLKNMQLPEVEDISKFDPEAFMNEYKQSKDLSALMPTASLTQDQQDVSSTVTEKHWLELEEVNTSPELPQEIDKIPVAQDTEEVNTSPELPQEIDKTPVAQDPIEDYTETRHEETISRNDFLSGTTTTNATKPRMKLNIGLIVLLWIVLTAAIFFGFIYLDNYVSDTYGSYSDMVDEITNGKVILDTGEKFVDTTSVLVTETTTKDGSSAHLFSIDTAAGKSVTLLPLGESFTLTDSQINIVVSDEDLFKSLNVVTNEERYATDALTLKVQTDKNLYTYPLDALTLVLEKTHYVRSYPTQSILSTADSTIDVIVTVLPGTSVSINEVDYSDDVDAHGVLSAHLDLSIGDNEFKIEAIHSGNAAVEDAFAVIRQASQTTLSPATEYLRIYADEFTCYGSTDADAQVTAFVGDSSYSALVDDNGAYSLSCAVEGYGLHDIMISAVSDGRGDADTNLFVEFIPDINSFMIDAQTFSIKNTPKHPDTLIKAFGTASEISSDTHTLSFTLADNTGTLPCYYHGTSLLEEDKEYTIYGMFDAQTDSFYAMYVL